MSSSPKIFLPLSSTGRVFAAALGAVVATVLLLAWTPV